MQSTPNRTRIETEPPTSSSVRTLGVNGFHSPYAGKSTKTCQTVGTSAAMVTSTSYCIAVDWTSQPHCPQADVVSASNPGPDRLFGIISPLMLRNCCSVFWLAIVGVAACGSDAEDAHAGDPRPTLVRVAEGRTGSLRHVSTYMGLVRSTARAQLSAGASGPVLDVAVREGDRVEAGQVLVRIDSGQAQAQVDAARAAQERADAESEQAQRERNRFETAGERMVSASEIDRARANATALEAQRRSLRAQLRQARETLDRHRVIAPFDGIVSLRNVDRGDWVDAGTEVIELVADLDTEILMRVDPSLLEAIAIGHPAEFNDGERSGQARVVGIVRVLDPTTRTAQLRLLPIEATPWLLAGAAVDVRIEVSNDGNDGDDIIVPRDALIEGRTGARVIRVVDGQAEPVTVEVLDRAAEEIRIRGEGLSASDQFVTRGGDRLRPGQSVRTESPETPSER